jgi:hypothetical protein
MPQLIELGLDTFGDITAGADGAPHTHAHVIRDVIAEGVLADVVGVDAFGVGEHHRPDFAVSTPDVVLAAIAGQTKRIWLGSAVTVLSSDDPVRVFQRFSTLTPQTAARKSRWAAVPSSNPSRCSATTSKTTTRCSRKNSTCSPRYSKRTPSPGAARRGRRSPISASFRRSKTARRAVDRSELGLASAAARNRWCARRGMTCR